MRCTLNAFFDISSFFGRGTGDYPRVAPCGAQQAKHGEKKQQAPRNGDEEAEINISDKCKSTTAKENYFKTKISF